MTRREWFLALVPALRRRSRQQLLKNMQLVMGPLPRRSKAPLEMVVLETAELASLTRMKITFRAEPDDPVPAYLLLPRETPAPAVLCLHQNVRLGKAEPAGLAGNADLHYARELAGRGYLTLAPDYPNLGEYSIDPYQRGYASATMKGIWNHMRAVDLLESLPQVARNRIGCLGHSLGGHNTLFLAAFDRRVKAMATSCGFTSFAKYKGGDLSGWSHKGYMPRIADRYGKDPARMPWDFPELLAALAPRPLFINAPLGDSNFDVSGVKDCVQAATPAYRKAWAAERLLTLYPDCGHEFPPAIREQAYAFFDRWLRG